MYVNEDIGKHCYKKTCPDDHPYVENNGPYQECVATCGSQLYFINKHIDNWYQCTSSCSNYKERNETANMSYCVTSCNASSFGDTTNNNTCSLTCDTDMYWNNTITKQDECVIKCPNECMFSIPGGRNGYYKCVSQCPADYKYHYDNRTCTSQCTKGGFPFSYNKTCKATCGELYYWPESDGFHTAECTSTECNYYTQTEFGYECSDYNKKAVYIVLGIVGGLAAICCVAVVSAYFYNNKCAKCKRNKNSDTAKLIEDASRETGYVSSGGKFNHKSEDRKEEVPDVPMCPDIDAAPLGGAGNAK